MYNLTCPAFVIKAYVYLRNPTLELRESKSHTPRSKLCQEISYGKRKSSSQQELHRKVAWPHTSSRGFTGLAYTILILVLLTVMSLYW